MTNATDFRKKQHAQFITLITNDAAATELLELAVKRLNRLIAPELHKDPPKADLSSEDRVSVSMEGGLTTADPHRKRPSNVLVLTPESSKFAEESQADVDSQRREGRNVEGVLVQLKSELKDAELSLSEAKQVMASAGELDDKATSAIDGENSDPAANSDAHTMAIASLEKGASGSSFLQRGVGSAIRKVAVNANRVSDNDRSTFCCLSCLVVTTRDAHCRVTRPLAS